MKQIQTIKLSANSKRLFFLIHGYTGSPTDFNGLPDYLNKTKNADVKIILLKGHGTNIKELGRLNLNDFLSQVKHEFEKELNKYDEIIVGGVSFGAQLALYLAANYPVQGVFNVCIPYKLKFPFNIPYISSIGFFKKYWTKYIPEEEKILRTNSFHYKEMHIKGLKMVKNANKLLKKELPKITCPILTIHSKNDPIGNHKAIKLFDKKINTTNYKKIFDDKNHNIFFTNNHHNIYEEIGSFFTKKEKVIRKDKIAAIIPAYNESENIERVLTVLSKTKILDEIIVVDDGSKDKTSEIVRKFKKIKLIKNLKNIGKGYSMQRGIDATNANIIFFCDADLKGLTSEIVEKIINPVIERKYNMYIGIRNNITQKTIMLFALNSGERALTRELWDNLPENFKYRYRIEAGLNFIAKLKYGGYGWQKFDYYQTLKEKKCGIIRGTFLRWWMNFDVMYAYILSLIKISDKKLAK
jgi:esterase/lipase